MNVWLIAWKELKSIREIKQLIFLIATPIILVLILGTVLTNAFNGSTAVGNIRVLYIDSSIDNEEIIQYFQTFTKHANESGIIFEQIHDRKEAQLKVENKVYVGYVDISDKGLHYYGNNKSKIESEIAESYLKAFNDRYKLAIETGKINQVEADQLMNVKESESLSYAIYSPFEGTRQPSAMDYYAIAMITLLILYGAMSAADLIDVERKQKTADRLLASPITKMEIMTGKIIGSLLQNFISVIIVVLVCKYMFNVYWGDHIGFILLILLTEVILALSMGIGMSYLFKSNVAGAIIMIIIQIGAFVGGSYYPTIEMTGIFRMIANLFPVTWVNDALIKLIYMSNSSAAVNAMLLNIGFSILLLSTALVIMRKREGI